VNFLIGFAQPFLFPSREAGPAKGAKALSIEEVWTRLKTHLNLNTQLVPLTLPYDTR
jgi:hypothetical protein